MNNTPELPWQRPYQPTRVSSSLTWEIVREIRAKYVKQDCSLVQMAYEYSLSARDMSRIIRNETWVEPDIKRKRRRR